MRILPLLMSLALIVAASPQTARADAQADATAVVDALITKEMIAATFSSMGPLMRQALTAPLTRGAAQALSPEAREKVISEFLRAFQDAFQDRMRTSYIEIYRTSMSTEELAALRAYLATPEGAAFAEKQPVIVRKSSEAGGRIGRTLGTDIGNQIGKRLADENDNWIESEKDVAILRKLFPSP